MPDSTSDKSRGANLALEMRPMMKILEALDEALTKDPRDGVGFQARGEIKFFHDGDPIGRIFIVDDQTPLLSTSDGPDTVAREETGKQ